MSKNAPPIILFDYLYSPNGNKCRNLLHACGLEYEICDQPFTMPRPIMADLGIAYRRIPVSAIGKDLYCDTRVFLEAVQTAFPEKALARSPADQAYEEFGYRCWFSFLPMTSADVLSKEMVKDRKPLFPVFQRPDYASLRPSAFATFKQCLDIVENDFLQNGPWIGGEKCSLADIHAMFMIKWKFQTGKAEQDFAGLGKDNFPKVHRWIESLPTNEKGKEAPKIDAEAMKKKLLSSEYSAKDIGIDPSDPTGLKKGSRVSIEPMDDAEFGVHPQVGKLVGLGRREMVIELENGLRLHFPRIGFSMKEA